MRCQDGAADASVRISEETMSDLRALLQEARDKCVNYMATGWTHAQWVTDGAAKLRDRIDAALAEPVPEDARNAALEEAARECEKLAELREQGAGDSPPGHRLRQAARYIRALAAAPRYPKSPTI